jgi:hypothetical protein
MAQWMPCRVDPAATRVELEHPVVDDFLELVRARCRPNTVLATAYDLKVFFPKFGGVGACSAWVRGVDLVFRVDA